MVEEFSNQIPIYYPYMEKQIYYVLKLTTLIFNASAQTLSLSLLQPPTNLFNNLYDRVKNRVLNFSVVISMRLFPYLTHF